MASASAELPQETEVAEVKAAFPGRCRIIKDIGMFTHVVTLQPKDMDVTLKFQLAESYPTTIPQISVRSESLTSEKSSELSALLTSQAGEMLGQPMMQKLVVSAEGWLDSHGVKPNKTVNANAEIFLTNGKQKQKKHKNRKKKGIEEDDEAKKPPMKTADDVVKRILWDDKLEKDDFLVGYLDRFRGVVEKYFSVFSWEDIASVDYDVLAVPKHRIQYFKYRTQKVWDKPSRMDNVFGSTGSGITIYDVIKNYQEPSPAQAGDGNGAASSVSTNHEEGEGSYSESDDSDDGITVTIGSSVNTPSAAYFMDDVNEDLDDDDDCQFNPFWRDKLRPNYFLAVRITDPEIRQGVEQIHDYLLDNEPLYEQCCIPPQALHVTLCTLGLDTPEQVAHATNVLQQIQPELSSARPKQPLHLQGVANFFCRVVYAKVSNNQSFMDFVDLVKMLVREAGVEIRDNHDFVPHMTIMKVTRPVARQKGSKNVNPWLYSNFTDMDFGLQPVNSIYLCSMANERREDGFYVCPAEINFN